MSITSHTMSMFEEEEEEDKNEDEENMSLNK